MGNYQAAFNDTSTLVEERRCQKEESQAPYSFWGFPIAVTPTELMLTLFPLGFVILTTIIGNILVILSVFIHRPLRIVQNFFIVSLAVADLTVAILVLPLNVAYSILGRWVFGKYVCKMWLTCDVLCCTASIFNLCAIAVDRYWAITDPINYACKRTLKRVIIMILITWILSAIISSPPLIGWNDWPDVFHPDTPCKLTSEKGYVIYSATGSFFFPLFTMTAVYLEIFRATRKRLRDRAKASKLNALKNNNEKTIEILEQQSVMEHEESVSSELNHDQGSRNSFRKWKFPKKEKKTHQKKINKGKDKKTHKGKEKSSQNSLLVPKRPIGDESLSDPKCGPSSEEAEVLTPDTALDIIVSNNNTTTTNGATQQIIHSNLTRKSTFVHQFIEEKQKISLHKERKAARTLGIIMGVFVICWLPFFVMYVTLAFCENCCLSNRTINIVTWLGYINSALNPIIYTIFNMDFRKAFRKLLHLKTT